MTWSIAIDCDGCGHYYRLTMPDMAAPACPRCGHQPGTPGSDWSLASGCPICSSRHCYRRKDFSQLLGLVIMVAGAVLGLVVSYWFLLGFVLVDIALYRLVPDVAVCYRCAAEIRGVENIAQLDVFDHHIAEMYQFGSQESDS